MFLIGFRYGAVPRSRKNLLVLPMGRVTVFCPPTSAGAGLAAGVQTTSARKSAALSRTAFNEFRGQAMVKLFPVRDRLSVKAGTVAQRRRKNRLPEPMGTMTVV